jgi:hypothetical protein
VTIICPFVFRGAISHHPPVAAATRFPFLLLLLLLQLTTDKDYYNCLSSPAYASFHLCEDAIAQRVVKTFAPSYPRQ